MTGSGNSLHDDQYQGDKMRQLMCYILMGVVLLAGCTEYRLSQKDAVKNALSFQSDRKAIKDTTGYPLYSSRFWRPQ
jgi:hypothetical protein